MGEILAENLKWYQCEDFAPGDNNGGDIDLTAEITSGIANNAFPNVTDAERIAGATHYAKIFFRNENEADCTMALAWIQANTPAVNDEIQILRAVLPGPAWEGTIDLGPAVDYRQEYTDILSHVVNLANVMGYDWRVQQQEDRYQVTSRTATTITVAGAGWPSSPQTLAGRILVVTSGEAKFRAATITSHTSTTLSFSGTSWITAGLQPGDAIRIFGPFRLDVQKYIGATMPRKTFTVNETIFDSSTGRDIERVANAIAVPGTASITQDRKSVISGNTLLTTPITVMEAVLWISISSSSDVLPVDSTAGFPAAGTIWIGIERIAYTSLSPTSFRSLTRGSMGQRSTRIEPGCSPGAEPIPTTHHNQDPRSTSTGCGGGSCLRSGCWTRTLWTSSPRSSSSPSRTCK